MRKAKSTYQQNENIYRDAPSVFKRTIRFIAAVISNNSVVKRIAAKYPRLFQFFLNRLTPNRFSGLPFTLLLTATTANLLLLNEITESIENSPWMLSIDKSFARFLFSIRITTIADALLYFTMLGSIRVVIIIALAAIVIFLWKKNFVYLIASVIALVGTGATVLLGKNYFHRIRPTDFGFYSETSFSFPSGHATIAVAFYGLLFYAVFHHFKRNKIKFLWITISLSFILLLGFSRLYLGVHYLSDVVAGYSLGFLWLLLALSIVEWSTYNKWNSDV